LALGESISCRRLKSATGTRQLMEKLYEKSHLEQERNLENHWRQHYGRVFPITELAHIFGKETVLEVLQRNLREAETKHTDILKTLHELYGSTKHYDENTQMFLFELRKAFWGSKISYLLKQIDMYKRQLAVLRGIKINAISQAQIETAKTYPFEDLLGMQRSVNGKRRRFYSCPFHSDRTPSFLVDIENRAHCFSCGFHGDTISFVMKRESIPFKEAIALLS